MALSFLIVLAALHSAASAANIYVSSYGGSVDALAVTEDGEGIHLSLTDRNSACDPSPAWLTWDPANRVLYCLDEGLMRDNGSVSSFQTSEDGLLTFRERKVIPSGPSGGVIYNDLGRRFLALSHYNGSSLSLWDTSFTGIMSPEEQLFFYQDKPGPGPRQIAPHQHHILVDPTGEYLVALAFGLDEIQVFAINGSTVQQLPSSAAAPGSGPRHGTFWSPSGAGESRPLYFFVIAEITSALTSYEVTYTEMGLNFTEVEVTNTLGGAEVPEGNGPAEIAVSPDNRFLVVSNRNSTITPHASLRFTSSVQEYWDNLASFLIQLDGTLSFQELIPSGGGFPRNFVFNKKGDRVAVALQSDSRVAILDRDVESGKFGEVLANITIQGEPNCLVWDE